MWNFAKLKVVTINIISNIDFHLKLQLIPLIKYLFEVYLLTLTILRVDLQGGNHIFL